MINFLMDKKKKTTLTGSLFLTKFLLDFYQVFYSSFLFSIFLST